ncbi:Cytoplasmic polyadenylation element-binding protein 2 [Frankliniella fusca]|uniref:Cytoplasmic polyadenylation element-binding protein 2 n=1 Tax=Frankliniella fusca TaxID=407009 RepID=A0AAE1LE21_9NEOP|nr:Cytoplasmic polyadenylation element-binding protein 2 [Frankliniella fusca]
MASYIMSPSPHWRYPVETEQNRNNMNLNNNYSANTGSYLRPRVVYSKGPCPLSSTTVPSLSNMMMGLGFQDNLGRPERPEKYSRKVFIGGLPPDINEKEIYAAFRRFGHLTVNWPQKGETRPHFPPRGYAFLIFQEEESVQLLIDSCIQKPADMPRMSERSRHALLAQVNGTPQRFTSSQPPVVVQLPVLTLQPQLYISVSSHLQPNKLVQIRPWSLADAEYILDDSMPLDPRKTVFVGGVPRPFKAVELACLMNELFGNVCRAGIDTDPDLKYPKGAARVAFTTRESYLRAIEVRFVEVQMPDQRKRMEVKPFVLDEQLCDQCVDSPRRSGPYFCGNLICLQYYCEMCWSQIHSDDEKQFHKPIVKEWADRPRTLAYRRC